MTLVVKDVEEHSAEASPRDAESQTKYVHSIRTPTLQDPHGE